MAKIWSDIVVPIAVATAVLAQTVGVEASRASRLHAWFPQVQRDTLRQDTLKRDSLKRDTLKLEDEFDLFAEAPQDTVPAITARDTMKVPDSLQVTDPFLYQWYVATKDSYTHKVVVDSLKAEGDTLIWPRVDSLYLADSTLQAQIAWEKKWNAMTKKEQKRWTYEHVELPRILHRQDSTLKAKDSLKRVRDSIIENTPRILETAFLPDSLHYKRFVTWRHNRLYNSVETFQWDTTANYHFYDYPVMRKDVGATWLGMPGSAIQPYNFFLRQQERSTSFYQGLESWTYTPDDMVMWNTKTPYTELEYYGNILKSSSLSSDNFRVFTTQNILPSLNVALEMKRYGGAGTLQNEETKNNTYFVTGNYMGKKYLAHAGFIYNRSTRQESGGMQETQWIRDTTVDVREIAVNLAAASNRYKKISLFYDQSYRIPFDFIEKLRHRGDSTWVKADTLNTNITTGFIGTSTEYTTYTKKYVDKTSTDLSDFYNGVFNIDPGKSADSLRTMRLENRIFVRLQPWKENAIVSKVEGGIGHKLQHFYLQDPSEVLYKPVNHKWNSVYAYAGVEGRVGRFFEWDATGLYNFAGQEVNDFFVKANAKLNIYPFRRQPKSPISLNVAFETRLQTPDFYQQHFYSNHFKWENNFSKTSTTKIHATLDIPKWRLNAQVGYALLAGHVYYDTLGIVRQHAPAMSVLTVGLRKDFVFGPAHLENSALFQMSSQPEIMPLPTLALNLRWYAQFNIVDPKVLQLQLGVNARYTTLWYAPSYNPVAGVFMLQKEETYGNCPVFDVFINMQWKKCCIFVKLENAGNGWPMDRHDYFTAHRYIQTSRVIKLGISWPFYPRLGTQKTLSERAGSGFGAGGNSRGSGSAGGAGGFGGGASSGGGSRRSAAR